MRFTNFGSVVKTYKKNFLIRKEKFIAERKAIQAKKKKDREDRIETVKAVQPLIKLKGGTSKKTNFLDDVKKFLGLLLVGFIALNLKNILPILENIIKKIGDIIKGTKEFVEGVIGGIQNFFGGLDNAKKKMEDLLSPILNADLSKFVPFQNQLDKVLTGVLGIAALITGLYQGGKAGGDGNLIDETAKGSAQGVNIAAQRKAARIKALNEAKKLRAQKQAQRIAAREAAATKAAKEAAERIRRVQKVFGQQTPAGVRTSGGSGTVYSRGVVNPSDKNFAAIIKNELKKLDNKKLADILFFDDPKVDSQTRNIVKEIIDERLKKQVYFTPDDLKSKDLTRSIFDENTPKLRTKKFLPSEVPSTTPSPDKVTKFNQIMKNARGFIKPSNLKLLRGFAKDLGAGIAIEFFAGWAIDRGLEAIGQDQKSILERNVLRFNQLDKEKQKSIIERKNKELEKELKYQKTFFAKAEKVIALGDMTLNERKIKALASFLTAVSISGAGSVYDLVSAGPLPDYLGEDVDITLPFISKIGMPSLPPTGTGSPALAAAQQYGAARPGGRRHAGQDFDITGDEKFYSRIGGVVIYAGNAGGAGGTGTGYGMVVDIYNKELNVTERIAEARKILPGVVKGARIKPGQAVVQGEDLTPSGSIRTGVIHYEIRKGRAGHSGAFEGTLDPLKFLEQLKKNQNQNQASIKTSPSSLISNAGLNQSTTYSDAGMSVRREVNNIFIPINA